MDKPYLGWPAGRGRQGSGQDAASLTLAYQGKRAALIAGADVAAAIGVDLQRLRPPFDDLAVDHDFADPDEAWQLEHRIEQDRLHDRAQTACPGLPGDRLLRDAAQRLVGQLEADILHLEQSLVLLDQGALPFGQNIDEGALLW